MAGQPEKRSTLGHLLNVSMPFSKTEPVWKLICKGVDELTEEFNPDTDEQQFICDDVKTTILKTYAPNFEISMGYQKDELIQYYFDVMSRRLPTGEKTNIEYIRFNKNETMFGTDNQFIGVRWNANVYFDSVGGSGDEYLTSVMNVSATGTPEVGYISVTDTGNGATYTWNKANIEVPFVTSFEYVDPSKPVGQQNVTFTMSGYFPGYAIPNNVSTLTVRGQGVSGHTIELKADSGLSATDTVVQGAGDWSSTINLSGEGTKSFAFIQKDNVTPTPNQSVNTQAFTFKLPTSIPDPVSVPFVKTINSVDTENVNSNTEISGTQFTVTGSGNKGYNISLEKNSNIISAENVTVDQNGTWSMDVTIAQTQTEFVNIPFSFKQINPTTSTSSNPTVTYNPKIKYQAG